MFLVISLSLDILHFNYWISISNEMLIKRYTFYAIYTKILYCLCPGDICAYSLLLS